MPYACWIDADQAIAFHRGWGLLRGPEVTDALRALYADARFGPHLRATLVDLRAVTSMDLTPDDLRAVLATEQDARAKMRPRPLVIVASGRETHDLLLHLYATLVERGRGGLQKVEVLASMEDALTHLDATLPAAGWPPPTDAPDDARGA
jgi:hypothetical protein